MRQRGFTLIEVLVAMAILLIAALSAMQLVAMALRTMAEARLYGVAANLASARLEQLRALRFDFDVSGMRHTDLSTDVAADPPTWGGRGLAPSGAGALAANTAGYVDFLDGRGRWVGTGTVAPAGAVLVRRWAIEPLDGAGDLLAVQVLVRPVLGDSGAAGRRTALEARFATLRVRVVR